MSQTRHANQERHNLCASPELVWVLSGYFDQVKWDPTVHDDDRARFYEPLPTGPYKGKAADKKRVDQDKKKYYKAVGWDKDGIPTTKILNKLELEDVDKALAKLRQ